ncbi:MAG: hypothetical protein WC756_12035 [Taibaiella sp.]|jgi:hypothetical protein
MARSVEVRGRIDEGGKMFITNSQHIFKWLKGHREKEIRLTIEEFGEKRTSPQNRYYRGVVVPMVRKALNDFGNEMNDEETHDFLKSKFSFKEIMLPNGVLEKAPISTTKYDTVAFMTYISKIQKFASEELFICIPDPDPNWETEFFNYYN